MLMLAVPVRFVTVPEDGVPRAPPLVIKAPAEPTLTASAVATLVPRPETPVDTGRPVQLVSVPEDGVPRAPPFVTNAPDDPTFTANAVATFVPRPETPVLIGRPVQLVSVPLCGVPRTGVTRVGVLAKTRDPEPVSSEITPASSAEEVAANAEILLSVVTRVLLLGMLVPLMLVAVATPSTGVTSVGVFAKTRAPDPVSSEMTPANSDEEVAAITESLSVVTTRVLLLGIVVPLMLVAVATPSVGVTSVGLVALTALPLPVVVIGSRAVPPELTATIFEPLPVSTGSLSKPSSIAANSDRMTAEDP